jgi:hypothetical protein
MATTRRAASRGAIVPDHEPDRYPRLPPQTGTPPEAEGRAADHPEDRESADQGGARTEARGSRTDPMSAEEEAQVMDLLSRMMRPR